MLYLLGADPPQLHQLVLTPTDDAISIRRDSNTVYLRMIKVQYVNEWQCP
jgi:hypothetical protein